MKLNTPCEIIVWQILPAIRRELVKNLIKNHGLTQKETAEKLGLTEAAVSRYISGKRGATKIFNGDILNEITKSVNLLVEGNGTTVIEQTCRICNILKASEVIEGINYSCK